LEDDEHLAESFGDLPGAFPTEREEGGAAGGDFDRVAVVVTYDKRLFGFANDIGLTAAAPVG